MKLTAVVLTRNEEKNIASCLKTLNFADEIIVIDNQSTDKTVKMAEEMSARIFVFSGHNFSSMRNLAKTKAKYDWLLYVDADERVTPALQKEIKQSITGNKFSSYRITRKNYFFNHLWSDDEKMIRLIKKDSLKGWQGELHETARVSGLTGNLSAPLLHYTHTDLSSMVEKTNRWSDTEAQLRFQNHHPPLSCWRFARVMLTAFWDSYIKHRGFRAGTYGFIEGLYQSFSIFITYAKLYSFQMEEKGKSL